MFSKFFITRPKFAFIISILIVVVGLIAIKVLPLAQYPDVLPPIVQVTANYPGADSINMEKTVIEPLEEQINGVENMLYMFSQCSDYGSLVTNITFNVGSKPDINAVNTLIRTNIALPQLPSEVAKEGISVKPLNTDVLLYIALYSPTAKYDSIFLSNYLYLNLYDPISRLTGVGEVLIFGGYNYAMRVWVDPVKMAKLRVSISEVLNAIQEQNKYIPSGQIGGPPSVKDQQFAYTLLTQERLVNVDQFNNIVVRAQNNGSVIRLKDIARVELGSMGYEVSAERNGKPTAILAVYLLPSANAIKLADQIRGMLEKSKKKFPPGLDGEIVYDTTTFVKVSMREIVKSLIIAIILVVLVVYVFLSSFRAMLIPAIAIPVSLIGTFAVLLILGYSINTISLFGLMLSIGIVVDNAIVVVENVYRIMDEEGLAPVEATIKGMNEVTGSIVAMTMVLMAVFVPIAFIPGISGQLYRQFAVTIASSVGISAINALTLSPALCATLLKMPEHGRKPNIIFRLFNKFFEVVTKYYSKIINLLVKRSSFVILIFILMMVGAYFIYTYTPTAFLPTEDQGLLNVDIQMPSSSSLARTSEVLDKVRKIVSAQPGVEDVLSAPGMSVYNLVDSSNSGHIMVKLQDWSKRKSANLSQFAIKKRLVDIFKTEIPEAQVIVFDRPPIPGLGSAGGFQFELQQELGNNPSQIAEVLSNFLHEAEKQPELTGLYSNYEADIPKLKVNVNIEKVKKIGISLNEVYSTINAYVGSYYVNNFNLFGKIFQVMIQSTPEHRATLEDIKNIYVMSNQHKLIPLSTFINIERVLGPNLLNHYNMLASAEIEGSAAKGYSSGQAIAAMERVAKKVLPEGFTYSWTGTAYQEILAGNVASYIFMLVILFIYFFLVAKYESWIIPFAVMLSIPVAAFGSLLAISLAGINNDIYVQVGLVLIFGMAAKTAILVVEFANEYHKKGQPILEAAKNAAKIRFRAVAMTCLAFILGVYPLVVSTGAGAFASRSVGTSVFGGMIAVLILGSLFVPCFYVIFQKLIDKSKKK